MSSALSPDTALQMIPTLASRDCRWEPVQGGLTNRSYRVEAGGQQFILRLDDEHTASFCIDRRTELKARRAAHDAGLAAEVLFSDIEKGIMLSEFIEGNPWSSADLDDDSKLQKIATLIRQVHALPSLGRSFQALNAATRYMENLTDRPGVYAFAEKCYELIAAMPTVENYCCCHNDIIADNVIGQRDLKLLDWEYARDNDPMFDLASLIGYHNLQEKRQRVLLTAYSGQFERELWEQLQQQVRVFDAIQWLWFALRHRISPDVRLAERLEELQQRIYRKHSLL